MFKVLVWDYTGESAQWLEQFADMKYISVVDTITSKDPVPEILLNADEWDFLLIFERDMRNFFDSAIKILKLPPDKVIYSLDMNSWFQHTKAALTLTDSGRPLGSNILLHLNFHISRQLNDFISCTVEGLSYVATSKDNAVMRVMYTTRRNHAADNMKTFQALVKKYYDVDDSTGYFLDLGANIGTTGIYFTKKLAPNLKLLAFEPDAENFKLLRMNLIFNDIGEDKGTAVNLGLGEKSDEMTMYRNLTNPGGNGMFNYMHPEKENFPTETIKIIPLDDYLAENNIAAQEVKYIWIDTEGFEPQVLLGAKNLLRENPAPIFMEFNPMLWNKSGFYEKMMSLLEECGYDRYIWVLELQETGKEKVYPLQELWKFRDSKAWVGSIGDIFLIKKSATD